MRWENNMSDKLKNSIIVVGLDNTVKMVESLLSSGYKVKIKYFDKVDDVDNMWIVRRYMLVFQKDDTNGFPSGLDELFKDYEGPKPSMMVDDDNVYDDDEIRKD
jgi:ribulose bisphosphate carboxylase small subunit